MKRILFFFFLLLFVVSSFSAAARNTGGDIEILVFWGRECYNCTKAKLFLYDLEQEYPEIEVTSYEVFHNKKNLDFFKEKMKNLGEEADIIPTIIIGELVWVGFTEGQSAAIAEAVSSLHAGLKEIRGINRVSIPFISSKSVYLVTLMIALLDGFNPCSLWVLTYLLGLIVYSRSRQRTIIIGLPFLLTSACVYGLFILGIIRTVSFMSNVSFLKILVSLFTLIFAVVNIKDYFYFQRGLSFTIADKYKPAIIKKFHLLKEAEVANPVLIGMSILTAFGITLIELPCTAGFPLLWGNIMAEKDPGPVTAVFLFALYILVYFMDELVVFLAAVVSFKILKIDKTRGRNLKLVSGIIMLFFSITLLWRSELLINFPGSFYIFISAVIISLIIIKGKKKLKAGNPEKTGV